MATYTLTGSGVQAVTGGTVALYVAITVLPEWAGTGPANPPDNFGVGLIRAGNASAFWEPLNITGGPLWMPIPNGTTRFAYAIVSGATVTVTEAFGSHPLAFPLASLPDVALASPADTQVLTYQASSQKWINAAASGGGTGGSGAVTLLQTQTLAAVASQVLFTLPSSGYAEIRISWQTQQDAGTTPQECRLQVNGDTGTTYTYGAFHGASGQTTAGFGADNVAYVRVGNIAPNSVTSASSAGEVRLPDYGNTIWFKQIDGTFFNIETAMNANQSFAGMVHGTWRNTAALTSVRLFPAANNFRIGSVFRMYGVA